MTELLIPREVDELFRYPHGRSVKLAKAKLLPAVFLPDGEIRFDRKVIEELLSDMARGVSQEGNGHD